MWVRPDIFVDRLVRVQREQWLSPDELAHRQWQRFERMLEYAARYSPFYRRKFAQAGLEPADIRSPDDLVKIPLTTRDELESSVALIADNRDARSLHESSSSGSTGQNVHSFLDDEAWLLGKYLLKFRARLACGVRPSDRIALVKAGTSRNSVLTRILLRQRMLSVHEPLEQTAEALRRYPPTVLYGFPNYIGQLAELIRPLPGLRRIFTSGEMLSEELRNKIELHLGAPVYDVYGCTEFKEIAWECPHRCGYHVNSDWLLVEALPSTTPQETDGMLAVTSLYNFAMPLIRYRLGDTGRRFDRLCDCGRGLPLMAPGFGRSVDYLRLPDGRLLSPYTVINAIEIMPGVRQFQICQTANNVVEVRIVSSGERDASLPARLLARLQPLLPTVNVRIKRVDEIQREPTGKYRMVISLLTRDC